MKVFVIQLLGIIFVTLIISSIQSATADHLEPGNGLFKNMETVELTKTDDTNYRVYLQTVLRSEGGQLVGVIHGSPGGLQGWVVPHKVTDHVFDTLMGEKEIVTIDNIKYEKVQYTYSPTLVQRWTGMYPIPEQIKINIKAEGDALVQMNKQIKNYALWKIHYCADFTDIGHPDGLQCIPIFQVLVPMMTLEPTDVITQQWTILRELN